MVEYKYDAWGKPIYEAGSLLSTLGNLNPFRYRGYVWDEETELYYLRSRYYDIETLRFLNADKYLGNVLPLNYNIFVYTKNNPTKWCDPNGTNSKSELFRKFADYYLAISKYFRLLENLSSLQEKDKEIRTKFNKGSSRIPDNVQPRITVGAYSHTKEQAAVDSIMYEITTAAILKPLNKVGDLLGFLNPSEFLQPGDYMYINFEYSETVTEDIEFEDGRHQYQDHKKIWKAAYYFNGEPSYDYFEMSYECPSDLPGSLHVKID